MAARSGSFRVYLGALLLTAIIGLISKFYAGPAAEWVNNSLSGVFYEIFWCLAVLVLFPHARARVVATAVFVVTCGLEFLQLWHEPHLGAVRRTFLGRALLGTSFTWLDFPYYAAGCGIAWWLIRSMRAYFRRTAVP
jgi:hypothetical protein